MKGYDVSTYGEKMANIYDDIQGDRDTNATVEFLAQFTKNNALELGIGTGRVAIPLAQKGIEVFGIDSSKSMLELLIQKDKGKKVKAELGNFAEFSFNRKFSLIYAVFGTFFCLETQELQVQCFRNVFEHLEKKGVFILECSIPDFSAYTRNQNVRLAHMSLGHVIVTTSEHDPVNQRTTSQHVVFTESGIKLLPACVRYAWPSELDLMGQIAGLKLRERWGNWHHSPFSANSLQHVSVYEKP